jgi:hypothetical protein
MDKISDIITFITDVYKLKPLIKIDKTIMLIELKQLSPYIITHPL